MQIGKRSKVRRQERVVEIELRTLISSAILVLMGVFLLFGIIRFVQSFLGVSRFEVVGECPYQASELAAGADIVKGDKLYRLDRRAAEKRLLSECAYLEDVEIKTSFPNKIKFVVKSHTPVWYLEISGDYYVLDTELNVLEETKNEERLYETDLIKLTLPNVKTAIVDGVLTFGEGEEEIEATKEIMQTVLESESRFMICSADIDNRYDIHFEFDTIPTQGGMLVLEDRFKVSVGGYSKLKVKLEYILGAISEENLERATGGSIDISDGGDKVSIRPTYSKPSSEESEETAAG